MKQSVYLFALFILVPLAAWCQCPGYMGKKTITGYGAHVSPVIYGSTAGNKTLRGDGGSAEKGFYRLNYTHDIFAERAFSTRNLIGISLKHTYTGYDNAATVRDAGSSPNSYYTFHAFTINPYLKFYSSTSVAPWGKYFLLGPSVNIMKAKYDEYMYVVKPFEGHDTLLTDFGPKNKKYLSSDVLMGWGRNRVFNNKISVDYGFSFHLFAVLSTYANVRANQKDYIAETMKSRLKGLSRYNFFVKVGYLF